MEFPERWGGGGQGKVPFVGEVWIIFRTTQYITLLSSPSQTSSSFQGKEVITTSLFCNTDSLWFFYILEVQIILFLIIGCMTSNVSSTSSSTFHTSSFIMENQASSLLNQISFSPQKAALSTHTCLN